MTRRRLECTLVDSLREGKGFGPLRRSGESFLMMFIPALRFSGYLTCRELHAGVLGCLTSETLVLKRMMNGSDRFCLRGRADTVNTRLNGTMSDRL